ncbi:MAG: hypothetical protein ACOYL6_16550 [Bacteriovoracaceae bacterium]
MDKIILKASLLRALKGVDVAAFQKVTVLLQNEEALITFYLKNEPTEQLLEVISEIETEMLADLNEKEVSKLSFKFTHSDINSHFGLEYLIFP